MTQRKAKPRCFDVGDWCIVTVDDGRHKPYAKFGRIERFDSRGLRIAESHIASIFVPWRHVGVSYVTSIEQNKEPLKRYTIKALEANGVKLQTHG